MLAWRVGLSACIVPALIGLFYIDAQIGTTAPILLVLLVLIAERATWEMQGLSPHGGRQQRVPIASPVAICVLVCLTAGWAHAFLKQESNVLASVGVIGLAYSLCVLFLFLRAAIRFENPGGNIERLTSDLFIVTYIGLLLAITSQLRWVAGHQAGYLAIGSLLVAAKSGDIGAYFVGRAFGKTKMAPKLSPGKTWAGFVGAVITSTLATWCWFFFATPIALPGSEANTAWTLLFGFVVGLSGLVGDLCESMLKRDARKKDSSELMPGFGGLLDLLDSILFAGPVAVLLWIILPLVGP